MTLSLTRGQRAACFAGRWPHLSGVGPCPAKAGYVYSLSSRLSIEITGVRRLKRGRWMLQYVVHDRRPDRDLYLLPTARSLKTDERGATLPMPAEEELCYTGNPKRKVLDAGTVPLDYQDVVRMQARNQAAKRTIEARTERAEELAREDARRVASWLRAAVIQAARIGIDPTLMLARVQREIAALEKQSRSEAA